MFEVRVGGWVGGLGWRSGLEVWVGGQGWRSGLEVVFEVMVETWVPTGDN